MTTSTKDPRTPAGDSSAAAACPLDLSVPAVRAHVLRLVSSTGVPWRELASYADVTTQTLHRLLFGRDGHEITHLNAGAARRLVCLDPARVDELWSAAKVRLDEEGEWLAPDAHREHAAMLVRETGLHWRVIAAHAGVSPSAMHALLVGRDGEPVTRIHITTAHAIARLDPEQITLDRRKMISAHHVKHTFQELLAMDFRDVELAAWLTWEQIATLQQDRTMFIERAVADQVKMIADRAYQQARSRDRLWLDATPYRVQVIRLMRATKLHWRLIAAHLGISPVAMESLLAGVDGQPPAARIHASIADRLDGVCAGEIKSARSTRVPARRARDMLDEIRALGHSPEEISAWPSPQDLRVLDSRALYCRRAVADQVLATFELIRYQRPGASPSDVPSVVPVGEQAALPVAV